MMFSLSTPLASWIENWPRRSPRAWTRWSSWGSWCWTRIGWSSFLARWFMACWDFLWWFPAVMKQKHDFHGDFWSFIWEHIPLVGYPRYPIKGKLFGTWMNQTPQRNGKLLSYSVTSLWDVGFHHRVHLPQSQHAGIYLGSGYDVRDARYLICCQGLMRSPLKGSGCAASCCHASVLTTSGWWRPQKDYSCTGQSPLDPREHLQETMDLYCQICALPVFFYWTNDITGQALRELRVEDNGLKSLHLWRRYSDLMASLTINDGWT